MPKYRFVVEVDTDTQAHAERVMAERCDFDDPYYELDGEWYGDVFPEGATTFEYTIEWTPA